MLRNKAPQFFISTMVARRFAMLGSFVTTIGCEM